MKYQPPYTITPAIVNLVAEIGETIGRYTVLAEQNLTPSLRRENRIRTIQASLAIENNTLTLEQVTAVIEGKRVLGHPREIQEVRNAFTTYEAMEDWDASVEEDLLAAHELLMRGLVDETGRYRSGGVGISRGEQLVHMAPPADRVPKLMADLLDWLENFNEHPLVASCIFHYEFEFIHPFADGNGRMGRLTQHGIAWEKPAIPEPVSAPTESAPAPTHFTTDDKIALFRRLFRGREDVYPQRWESAKGTSGYSPACGNEWKPGVCHKPRVKCGDCNQRQLLPLTDQVIYDHLAGKQTIGVYPLLSDDSCYFLAADFDEADWREDAQAFMQSCRELGIPAVPEISRSGKGSHAWIFFAEPVPAREARQLGAARISHTCDRTRQLSLASYDRLFPNQDTMPKGGFGKPDGFG